MHINKHKRIRKDLVIHAGLHVGFSGYFTVELIDAATGRVKRHLEFKNLITDAGLNALNNTAINTFIGASGGNGFMGCGTNSTAPANADTTLGAEIAPASTNRSNSNGGIGETNGAGPANAYWFRKTTYNFIETQANGNLTEIGLFSASSGGTMWCRQLLKDGTGTPTVVVKTAADQLRVTYEIRFYSPADVTVNPLVISGANYSVTTRAIHIDQGRLWGGPDGFSTMIGFKGDNCNFVASINSLDSNTLVASSGASPAGTLFQPTSVAKAAYVPGNFFLDYTLIWDPGVSNPVGGVGGVLIRNEISGQTVSVGNCQFQMAFTPKIPKDNTKRLTLVIRLSWGRGP